MGNTAARSALYPDLPDDGLLMKAEVRFHHVEAEGKLHTHIHSHSHGHGDHSHVHANKKAVLGRMARAKGHLESIIRMIEDDRDCAEVLVQLAAVRSALNNVGKVILQDHIRECITEAVYHEDSEKIDELNRAIAQFIK